MNVIRGNIGGMLTQLGEYAQARAILEEVLRHHQQTGSQESIAATLGNLGDLARLEGDYAAAEPLLAQSLALWREQSNPHAIAIHLNNLARVATRRDKFAAAEEYVREAIVLRRGLGDIKGLLWSLDAAAGLAAAQGRPRDAARLYGAVEAVGNAHDIAAASAELAERDHYLALVHAELSDAEFEALWAQSQSLTLAEAVAVVLDGPK